LAFNLGADCVELHTGKFCDLFNKKKKSKAKIFYYKLRQCSIKAKKYGLDVHAGHGLTYGSASEISSIFDIADADP
jgi:pyridoxine 5-phosphate synthase